MNRSEIRITENLMFRLLPVQILLSAISAINGIVTGLFAANYVGADAMSAVGLYGPIGNFSGALGAILVGGASILCGQYLGKDLKEKLQNVFTLDILLSAVISVLIILFLLGEALLSNGFLTDDPALWEIFRGYLLGQAIGILPDLLGKQLAAFLSLENKTKRTTLASIIFIIANLCFNYLFLVIFRLEAFGLSLASSLGLWVFLLVEAGGFDRNSAARFNLKKLKWRESLDILKIGIPGGISFLYFAVRGILINDMILKYVGNPGLAAFSAVNSFLNLFWAIPTGMQAVSRMLFSVSIGEEDKQTVLDTMRISLYRFLPLQVVISLILVALAVPFTNLYYQDPASLVYPLTVSGFRYLPLCMPFSLICMFFVCYWQNADRQLPVHILGAIDGIAATVLFTCLLVPAMGMDAVYWANLLNGLVTTLFIVIYSFCKRHRFPKSVEDLMVVPSSFGVKKEDRMDLSVKDMEGVLRVSQEVDAFCLAHGLTKHQASLAGLFLEEMAGNVVAHGFTKDTKAHSVDIRVAIKGEEVILRLKDDCIPFDPSERLSLIDPEDPVKNLGIRLVYQSAKSVTYRNLLGLNVLTIII